MDIIVARLMPVMEFCCISCSAGWHSGYAALTTTIRRIDATALLVSVNPNRHTAISANSAFRSFSCPNFADSACALPDRSGNTARPANSMPKYFGSMPQRAYWN